MPPLIDAPIDYEDPSTTLTNLNSNFTYTKKEAKIHWWLNLTVKKQFSYKKNVISFKSYNIYIKIIIITTRKRQNGGNVNVCLNNFKLLILNQTL